MSIDELVAAVDAAINPALRDPQESLLYTSLTYADPAVARFDPPLRLGGAAGDRRRAHAHVLRPLRQRRTPIRAR